MIIKPCGKVRILKQYQSNQCLSRGILYTIEDRLEGRNMTSTLDALTGEARERGVREYMRAAIELRGSV